MSAGPNRTPREEKPLPTPPPGEEITADDVVRAREAWRKASSPTYRNLLDAKPVQDD